MKTSYIVIPGLTIVTMTIGSIFTAAGMAWYKTLILPTITPPDWVFSFVWTLLYTMITISVIYFWNNHKRSGKFNFIAFTFALNGLLNIAWPYLFFYLHLMSISIINCILLTMSTLLLIGLLYKDCFYSALLLVPYAAWTAFATILNWMIFMLNSKAPLQ